MAAIQQDDYFASAEETDETPPAVTRAQSPSNYFDCTDIIDRIDQLEGRLSTNKQELKDFGMYPYITTWKVVFTKI